MKRYYVHVRTSFWPPCVCQKLSLHRNTYLMWSVLCGLIKTGVVIVWKSIHIKMFTDCYFIPVCSINTFTPEDIWQTTYPYAIGWPDYSPKLRWILGELLSTCSLPLEIGCKTPVPNIWMNRPVCLEAHNYLLAHLWQLILSTYFQHQTQTWL